MEVTERPLKSLRIKYIGKGAKKVELPVPFISKCEKTGEVMCDPIGVFDAENGLRLLEISGEGGLFELVEKIYGDSPPETKKEAIAQPVKVVAAPEYYDKTCECGCGGHLQKRKSHEVNGIPRFIVGHSIRGRIQKKPELAVVESTPSPI